MAPAIATNFGLSWSLPSLFKDDIIVFSGFFPIILYAIVMHDDVNYVSV